jgi:hypothetical protein
MPRTTAGLPVATQRAVRYQATVRVAVISELAVTSGLAPGVPFWTQRPTHGEHHRDTRTSPCDIA